MAQTTWGGEEMFIVIGAALAVAIIVVLTIELFGNNNSD